MSSTIHRLRLPNGASVHTTHDFELYILNPLLRDRPMTPKELSIALNKSTKQIQRYLKPLRDSNKIQKIDGSDKYKLSQQKTIHRKRSAVLMPNHSN